MNNEDKDEFASFYIRQMLGLIVVMVAASIVGAILMMARFDVYLV